jgi:hypothetical protein
MASEIAQDFRQRVENYKRALKYLDECGDLTYDKILEATQIASFDMPESQLRAMWEQADDILPSSGQPGGKESLRFVMRNKLIEGIAAFESVADELGASKKKWWQFWK